MTAPEYGKTNPVSRADERRRMVDGQLITRGIKDQAVLQGMLTTPRHLFVPDPLQPYAYMDGPLSIGEGQTISQPYIVALMVEALKPSPKDRILEIGTGSGYAAAVLSRIVSMVYTVERHAVLVREAIARFSMLKYDNIRVRTGDGTKGWLKEAPFDGILVSAGAPVVPDVLCTQLKPGGRLVIPVGDKYSQDLLRVSRMPDGRLSRESLGAVVFVPLIGEEGWSEDF